MMLHQDGLDSYANLTDLGLEYTSATWISINSTGGRYGGASIHATNYDAMFVKPLASAQSDVWFGFGMMFGTNTLNTAQAFCGYSSVAGYEVGFQYNPVLGVISLVNHAGTVLAYGGKNLDIDVYHWFEIHAHSAVSGGVVELWIDDALFFTYSGNACATSNGTGIIAISFLGDTTNNAWGNSDIDDLYVLNTSGSLNNSRRGDSRIVTSLPMADVTPNNGTPSSGSSHFAMVDEVTSDYMTSTLTLANTPGQEEMFSFHPLSEEPSSIWSIRVFNTVKKTDGAPCASKALVRSGGVGAAGPYTPVLTSFSNTEGIFETDPATAVPWTWAAVNAVDAGFTIVAP